MDILILNWKDIAHPDVGGAEVIIYELAKRLVADGHTVSWFCRSFPGAQPEETVDGIRIIRRGGKLSVYFHAYAYYRSLMRKPDRVVDCINTIAWQTPLYVPKEKRRVYINQLAKEVFFYEQPFPFSWVGYLLEPLEYLTYKSSKVICYANSVKRDLMSFGIPEKNIRTFPLGLDQKRYEPKGKSEVPLFVFVARLTKMKRPLLCVEAMQHVIGKYPNAKLAVVGYGPQEHAIEQVIQQKGLQQNVILVNKNNLFFKKHVKDRKVALMQQSWALLLPSVKEGWGLVITEAGACGTPSIVTNVTGLQDSVIPEKTGIRISANPTSIELAAAMERVIQDKKLRSLLSRGAYDFSHQFTWEKSYKAFLALLEH
jgi:glycosyltransferase involved in cell wall biosynthesis